MSKSEKIGKAGKFGKRKRHVHLAIYSLTKFKREMYFFFQKQKSKKKKKKLIIMKYNKVFL